MEENIITSVEEMTAGQMLKNARTTGRRKREIATIAKLLCIREEFLTALEEGDYRVIPEDVYILGFARSYAVELGLNPDEVIDKLKIELGIATDKKEEKKEDKKEERKEENKIEIKCEPKLEQNKAKLSHEGIKKVAKSSTQYIKKHWIWFVSGVSVVIVLAIVAVVLVNKKHSVITETVATEETTVVETAVETKKEPDFRYPVREKFNEKSAKESRVVLQAEKESWVKIEDARGSTVFSRVLVPGDVYYMPLNEKLKGTFGNAGGIDVWVDGQLVNKVGPANTRKNGFSMAPDALKAVGLAE